MTTTIHTRRRVSLDHGFARFLRMSITGAIGAAILNLAAWYFAEVFQGVRLMVQPPNSEVVALSYVPLLTIGLIAAVGAALLYWILDRITNAPMVWFIIASIIVLVVTYFGPEGLPELVTREQKNWLQILHFTTAAGIIWAVLYVRGWFPIRDRA